MALHTRNLDSPLQETRDALPLPNGSARKTAPNSRAERIELIGKVAPDLAHSLNNSFNAMLLRLNLLREDSSDPRAHSHIDVLARLIGDTAEKIAALQEFVAQKDLELAPVDLRKLVETALSRCRSETQALGLELAAELALPSDLPQILAQPAPLLQALLELFRQILMRGDPLRPALALQGVAKSETMRLTISARDFALDPRDCERRLDPFDALRRGPERVRLLAAQSLIRLDGGFFAMAESANEIAFVLELPLARPPRSDSVPG